MAKNKINKIEPSVEEIPEIYTNSVKTGISIYEIMLQLGLESEGKIKPICNVRMSPQYPKGIFDTKNVVRGIEQERSRIRDKNRQNPFPEVERERGLGVL